MKSARTLTPRPQTCHGYRFTLVSVAREIRAGVKRRQRSREPEHLQPAARIWKVQIRIFRTSGWGEDDRAWEVGVEVGSRTGRRARRALSGGPHLVRGNEEWTLRDIIIIFGIPCGSSSAVKHAEVLVRYNCTNTTVPSPRKNIHLLADCRPTPTKNVHSRNISIIKH